MDEDRARRRAFGPSLAEQASPAPAFPTAKELQQIADAQRRAKKDREDMRAAGFGDHKGVEGA